MWHPLILKQRVLPWRHIFHGLNKISYGLRKRLHSCECALEHINLGGNNHWSWQAAGVVTSSIHDLWPRMRPGVCNLCMFWDAIFPCFRQIPSGTATKLSFFREWWLPAGLRKLPITQKWCDCLEEVKYRISIKKYPEFSRFKGIQREHWSLFPFPTQLI